MTMDGPQKPAAETLPGLLANWRPLLILLLQALLLALMGCDGAPPQVQEGDLVFQTSGSAQSLAIQLVTHSRYSHVGVVLFWHQRPYVFEAEKTVRYTPLEQWMHRGMGGHYVVKRLKEAKSILTPTVIDRLHQVAASYQGRPYDLKFEWSDDRLYCSELVWKLMKQAAGVRIGSLQSIKDFDLTNPLVQAELHERYGDHLPLNQYVISPAAMFQSPLLVTVAQQ